MFKFEIPRNVRAVRSFLGLTVKGWLWTLAASATLGSIIYIFTFNPIITIVAIGFIYYFIKTTFEIDERTGDTKIQVIFQSMERKTGKKKYSVRWGKEDHYEKTTVRTFIKGK